MKKRKNIPGININDWTSPDFYKGEVEVEVRDKHKRIVQTFRDPNLIKIFSKEMLAHRIAPTNIWAPAGSGAGAFVPSNIDPNDEFSIKYVLFGASFDDTTGVPLGPDDTQFYSVDEVTGSHIPVPLTPGATNDGGLIHPIPIADPDRPSKKVENVYFESSYQPTSVPFIDSDVRAMNNVLVVETTLEIDEYNGLGLTDSDIFTLTEVALVGGREIGAAGSTCDCDPHILFLEGSSDGDAISVTLSGGNVVTIDASDSADASVVQEGDQIKLVNNGGTPSDHTELDQTSPYYLVTNKSATGLEVELDRVPLDSNNTPLTGSAGIFRDSMRVFSHRILSFPVQKSASFEITVRWRIIFS